jgi:hypothetical protein
MKVLIWFNIFITYVLVFSRSPIGQVFLIILFTVFDGFTNMHSIALLLEDRVGAFVADPTQAQETSKDYALLASIAIGTGICMFNLITEVDDNNEIKSHRASIVLSFMSYLITMVGAMLFIIPPGTKEVSWTLFLIIKIILANFIAALSPYIVWNASRNLALTYSATFDGFMDAMIDKTHTKMTEQIDTALEKKKRRPTFSISSNNQDSPYKFNNAI